MTGTVYALTDSRQPTDVRYIGVTTRPLDVRLRNHLATAHTDRDYPSLHWMRSVVADGGEVRIHALETHEAEDRVHLLRALDAAEKRHVRAAVKAGCRLTNLTEGGAGVTGLRWSDEQRQRHSERMREVYADAELRKKHSEQATARMADPDARRVLSEKAVERMADPERRAAQSKAVSEWVHTESGRDAASRGGKTQGKVMAARRRRCDECGKVTNPASLGVHQKHTGHTGWTDITP